jgi:hypothetical protein
MRSARREKRKHHRAAFSVIRSRRLSRLSFSGCSFRHEVYDKGEATGIMASWRGGGGGGSRKAAVIHGEIITGVSM